MPCIYRPDRRIKGPLPRVPAGLSSDRLLRGGGGLGEAAPIQLIGRQDGRSVPRIAADPRRRIEGVVGDRVARDERNTWGAGVIGPRADRDRHAAPPFDPGGAVAGRPAMLPGCMLDIPPKPVMTNDVGTAVPPDGLPR